MNEGESAARRSLRDDISVYRSPSIFPRPPFFLLFTVYRGRRGGPEEESRAIGDKGMTRAASAGSETNGWSLRGTSRIRLDLCRRRDRDFFPRIDIAALEGDRKRFAV